MQKMPQRSDLCYLRKTRLSINMQFMEFSYFRRHDICWRLQGIVFFEQSRRKILLADIFKLGNWYSVNVFSDWCGIIWQRRLNSRGDFHLRQIRIGNIRLASRESVLKLRTVEPFSYLNETSECARESIIFCECWSWWLRRQVWMSQ